MTIATRTVAKGILPRLHKPKPKGKSHTKKSNTKTTQGSRKRAKADSDDESGSEEDEFSSFDNSESTRRAKKKAGKRRRVELSDSEEVEMVEDNEQPAKDIEEVDDCVGDEQAPIEQEVSPYHLLQA